MMLKEGSEFLQYVFIMIRDPGKREFVFCVSLPRGHSIYFQRSLPKALLIQLEEFTPRGRSGCDVLYMKNLAVEVGEFQFAQWELILVCVPPQWDCHGTI